MYVCCIVVYACGYIVHAYMHRYALCMCVYMYVCITVCMSIVCYSGQLDPLQVIIIIFYS